MLLSCDRIQTISMEEVPCKSILSTYMMRRLCRIKRPLCVTAPSIDVPFSWFRISSSRGYSYLILLIFTFTITDGFVISHRIDQHHILNKNGLTKKRRAGLNIGWPDELANIDLSTKGDLWQSGLSEQVYISPLLWNNNLEWKDFIHTLHDNSSDREDNIIDYLWEQIKLEAIEALRNEPDAGPQLYQGILSQGSLLEAIVTIVANEIETELIKATELKKLFLDSLTGEDVEAIRCDTIAAATRSPSLGLALLAVLFQTGLHALVCYRVGHRLWQQSRTGLAYYLQSTVSRQYSADIHPACRMGRGIYLRTASGIVIGETASVGDDVCILQGVTLGGTGKETGDRHPKVQHGVVLHDSATVLGNILVGTGAVISAKAIVTKPVSPLSIMSGVPAKPIGTRELTEDAFEDNLERQLAFKYLDEWRELKAKMESKEEDVRTTL